MSTLYPLQLDAANRPTPWLVRGAVIVLIQSLLIGCAQARTVLPHIHEPTAETPLPKGWHPSHQRPQQQAHPLWGVPSFDAPQATHCARPPQLTQVDGRPSHHQATTRHDRPMHRHGKSMRGEVAASSGTAVAAPSAAPAAPAVPAVPEVLPMREGADAAVAADAPRRERPSAPTSSAIADAPMPPAKPSVQQARVTAGMVDDNADFTSYLAFVNRQRDANLRTRDVSERYRVEVRDEHGRPVPDAELALSWPGANEAVVWARSDAGGTAWLHPRALLAPQALHSLARMEVMARSAGGEVSRVALQRGQKSAVTLRMASTPYSARSSPVASSVGRSDGTPLDLVFMVDATGSMGDEIDKLRNSMKTMADRIAALPGGINLCFGLVAYRDHGEEYLTRTYDLSNDLSAFQSVLSSLQAQAGGDEPEAVNEALAQTVHHVSWRGAGTTRLVVMIGDAPPHMNQAAPFYDQSSAVALARGIKVHAVGASGLNPRGEAVFRSIAQTTGGRFVFLTYQDARHPGRGPGTDTAHDVRDYSVSTLDDLIVRLVREEVGQRTTR